MSRKTEMPEDVRRTTGRNDVVRVSAPNTTKSEKERRSKIAEEELERSRPRLERANPNAVSAVEDRAMLERLRGEPLSRKGIRRIARDNGGVADRIVGLVDAALEGLEVAGGMSGPGPRAYGGSKTPGAATPVITSRNGVHKLRGFFADGRFFPGLPSDPATLPQENKPTRVHHGSRNSSGFGAVKVVPGDTSGFVFGYGASFSRRRSVARDLYALGDEYAEPTGREGYRSGYVRNGANIADMDFSKLSGKEFFNTLTADEVRTLRSLAERETRQQMRTGKTISAWQAILEALDNPTSERPTASRPTSGAGYVFTRISGLGRKDGYAGARFIQDYFKNRGYDGVSYRNGNNYEDEVLLFNPERDFMEDQATDTPLTPIEVQQASKGGNSSESIRAAEDAGDASGPSKSSAVPKGHNPALDGYSGPRVVINPSTFRNEKDSLCVAFNEAFRILMQVNGFDPVAEPTEKQRKFFSDTAYANDELQMRRTILARICTFDTSVTDPTDEQLQEAVEFLDTVLEIGAPQNNFEQRAVERIRTAISQALESGERIPASQAPAPDGSPEIAAGGAGYSAGGVPEDEEKDSGAEFRKNAQAQMDEAAKLAQEGPTAEEQKTQAMAEAAGNDPFGKSAEMNAAAQEAGLKADIAEAQKPESLMQKNGHYVDTQGRVISERAARALAEQGVRNSAAQDTNNQQQRAPGADMDAAQNSPQTASERIGTTSGIKGLGGRELTAGEAAWQARKQASTAAWMKRTGRSGDGVADTLAQRDERTNNQRQVDSGRRDALGRRLDDRGRVIA